MLTEAVHSGGKMEGAEASGDGVIECMKYRATAGVVAAGNSSVGSS